MDTLIEKSIDAKRLKIDQANASYESDTNTSLTIEGKQNEAKKDK